MIFSPFSKNPFLDRVRPHRFRQKIDKSVSLSITAHQTYFPAQLLLGFFSDLATPTFW